MAPDWYNGSGNGSLHAAAAQNKKSTAQAKSDANRSSFWENMARLQNLKELRTNDRRGVFSGTGGNIPISPTTSSGKKWIAQLARDQAANEGLGDYFWKNPSKDGEDPRFYVTTGPQGQTLLQTPASDGTYYRRVGPQYIEDNTNSINSDARNARIQRVNFKKNDMCKCGSGMMKSMCKCGGMSKSMLKSDMCKCGSGMMKSMCKCGGMGKSMYKAKSTGPIDPDNPYRRKSVQRQMDNNPRTSRDALMAYNDLDFADNALSMWQKVRPNAQMTVDFDVIGNSKTGYKVPSKSTRGTVNVARLVTSGPSRGSAARKRMSNVEKDGGGGNYVPSYDIMAYPKKKSGYGTNRSMYKADDKNKNTDWASKLSGAAVDFVLQNKNVIERKAKELSDQGFRYVDQNKSKIGRGARNLTEQGIDFLSANKSNVERGAKSLSDKGFDYVRRNKPNIEGVDYILDNKSNIERGAKDISDKAFDYARRNKSGIGQAAERMTNQAVDYAIRSKPAIEQAAKNYSDQGFDYLRRNKNEIGRQANNLISNAMGRTTKRAGAMSKSLQSNKKKNKYF